MLAFVHQAIVFIETLIVMSYFRADTFFTSQQRLFLTNCHLAFLGLGSVKTCSWHQAMEAHPRWTKAAVANVSWPGNETTKLLRDQPPQTNRTKPGKAGSTCTCQLIMDKCLLSLGARKHGGVRREMSVLKKVDSGTRSGVDTLQLRPVDKNAECI